MSISNSTRLSERRFRSRVAADVVVVVAVVVVVVVFGSDDDDEGRWVKGGCCEKESKVCKMAVWVGEERREGDIEDGAGIGRMSGVRGERDRVFAGGRRRVSQVWRSDWRLWVRDRC